MTTKVAFVTYGYSQYDDTVWDWLNKHREWFDSGPDLADKFDYWRAWGLLTLAGCDVEHFGPGNEADDGVDADWGDGVWIGFEGEVSELVKRLDKLMP